MRKLLLCVGVIIVLSSVVYAKEAISVADISNDTSLIAKGILSELGNAIQHNKLKALIYIFASTVAVELGRRFVIFLDFLCQPIKKKILSYITTKVST